MISSKRLVGNCFLAALLAILSFDAIAASSSITDKCDKLAADPNDPARNTSLPYRTKVDVTAIDACLDAIERQPEEPRYHYQLAYALHQLGYIEEAQQALGPAFDQQYPASFYLLAELIVHEESPGRDIEKLEDAASLYEFAAQAGYAGADDKATDIWQQIYRVKFVNADYRAPEIMTSLFEGAMLRNTEIDTLFLHWNLTEVCQSIRVQDNPSFISVMSEFVPSATTPPDIAKFRSGIGLLMFREDELASVVRAAEHDPVLFVTRHACKSLVASTFIGNIVTIAKTILAQPAYRQEVRSQIVARMSDVPLKKSLIDDTSIRGLHQGSKIDNPLMKAFGQEN